MNARWMALIVVVAAGLGFVAGHVMADAHEEGGAGMGPPKQGPEHKELQRAVGEWDAHMKYWTDPSKPPAMESMDAGSTKMIMNGWFAEETYSGTFQGQGWSGRNLLGYDQVRKHWISVWYSNMGSTVGVHTGQRGEDGVWRLYGTGVDPATMKERADVLTYRWVDDNTVKFEVHWTDENKKPVAKVMEITYTRKK